MTREEAINELTEKLMAFNPNDLGIEEVERFVVSLEMAIEALKEQDKREKERAFAEHLRERGY